MAHQDFYTHLISTTKCLREFGSVLNLGRDNLRFTVLYTIRRIEDMQKAAAETSFLTNSFWYLILGDRDQAVLKERYVRYIEGLDKDIMFLINHAKECLAQLKAIDVDWRKVHKLKLENINITTVRKDQLSIVWVWWVPHRFEEKRLDRQLTLLEKNHELHREPQAIMTDVFNRLEKLRCELQTFKTAFDVEGLRHNEMALSLHIERLQGAFMSLMSRSREVQRIRDEESTACTEGIARTDRDFSMTKDVEVFLPQREDGTLIAMIICTRPRRR